MKIINEKIYVIYHNGKPYDFYDDSCLYSSEENIKRSIKLEAYEEAKSRFCAEVEMEIRWHELDKNMQDKLINSVIGEFSIVEYVPKI